MRPQLLVHFVCWNQTLHQNIVHTAHLNCPFKGTAKHYFRMHQILLLE